MADRPRVVTPIGEASVSCRGGKGERDLTDIRDFLLRGERASWAPLRLAARPTGALSPGRFL